MLYVSIDHSFLLLNCFPLNGCITVTFYIYLLLGFRVVSIFWLFQIKLQRTFVFKSLYGRVLSFSLGGKKRSKMSGSYGRCVFKFLRICPNVFESDCTILHSHEWACHMVDYTDRFSDTESASYP